jgi:hypothetical protein
VSEILFGIDFFGGYVQHKIQIFTHECVAYSVRTKMPRRYGAGIITFQKLETLTNNVVYVSAWYIAGRGQPKNWAESCSTNYNNVLLN